MGRLTLGFAVGTLPPGLIPFGFFPTAYLIVLVFEGRAPSPILFETSPKTIAIFSHNFWIFSRFVRASFTNKTRRFSVVSDAEEETPERFAPNVDRKALNASLRLLSSFLTHFLSEGKENAPRRS